MVAVSEVGGAPAADRFADELLRADEECETDENDDRVLTTESVHTVVVRRQLYLTYTQQ